MEPQRPSNSWLEYETRMWWPYLSNIYGFGEINVHPDTYYTTNTDEVVGDVVEIIHKAKGIGLKQCKFICGKGIHNPRGEKGALRGEILQALRRKSIRPLLDGEPQINAAGGVIQVKFAWVASKRAEDELISRTKSRLTELPKEYIAAYSSRARDILTRIAKDFGLTGFNSLGSLTVLLIDTEIAIPPDVSKEVRSEALKWALVEIDDQRPPTNRDELERRIDSALSLLQASTGGTDTKDLVELLQSIDICSDQAESDWFELREEIMECLKELYPES